MANTDNAHIRKDTLARHSADVIANDAQRLLDDPAFKRSFEMVRDGLVRELENMRHDGSPEMDSYEREVCRSLRNLMSVRRAIATCVQGKTLREAGFKPVKGD